ncbi:low molecular weight protein-tyrosine-phosphatase [Amorphus orientalis]|uniref:protein-tyrosine-phosphatase n=1 Tax=Amorphus orientalis TaxID=649198 RepID=A0AAE3VKL4_9HYPH|nr:low molecular weight protein-tyrosine-phosphatase [Amorphus orientalis]MDQ0313864.1 protein-tyrosine phosphatase [Amorphus orientalis]
MTNPTGPSILVVCLGNICRSPMAAGILKQLVATDPQAGRIESAGVGPWHIGKPPDARAIATAARRDIDLTGERARMITEDDYRSFDLILAMDRSVLADIHQRGPQDGTAEIRLFREAAEGEDKDVADPFFGEDDGFEVCFDEIEAAARQLIRRLREPDSEGAVS